jgi:ferritin-like metal-binding protein YciE
MGLFTKDIKTLQDLFVHTLKDVYYAENQIVKSLPKLIEKATSKELSTGLKNHLSETKNQVKRLEQVFAKLDLNPKGVDCPAIDGLIKEADEVSGDVADKQVLDAAIVGSAQAVEHYEISRYGTMIAWAKELGLRGVIPLLKANLKEEFAADRKLTVIAEGKVNRRASGRRATASRRGASRKTPRKTASRKASRRTKAAPRRLAAARMATSKRTGPAKRR